MRILSPVNKVHEVKSLIERGIGELYCGVLSKKWLSTYSHAGTINGSPSKFNNLRSYDELKKVVDIAHSYSVSVFFTLNSHYYSKEQYPLLLKEIDNAIKCNIDAFIIADVGLLDTINKMNKGVELHVSVVGGSFNSKTLNFYRKIGASRVVLPKQLTIEEIKQISKNNKKIKLECFISTSDCPNEEAFCTFQHGVIEAKHPILSRFIFKNPFQGNLIKMFSSKRLKKINNLIQNYTILTNRTPCCLKYDVSSISLRDKKVFSNINDNLTSILSNPYEYEKRNGCGVCALPKLKKIGITSIKTEDRSFPIKERLNRITFLRNILKYIEKNPDKEDISNYAKEQRFKIQGIKCNKKYCNCLVN
jgi:putative protease